MAVLILEGFRWETDQGMLALSAMVLGGRAFQVLQHANSSSGRVCHRTGRVNPICGELGFAVTRNALLPASERGVSCERHRSMGFKFLRISK